MNNQPSPLESPTEAQDSWIHDRLPPPSAFFLGSACNAILERVHGLVENAEEVALLTGVQGSGKTTLLYRIQSDTPEHWLPCRVDANPMLHPDQLLNRLARCIDITSPDEEITESVAAGFCNLRLQGRLPVIMVDDAEQLPISSLMTLLRLHEQRVADSPACALIFLAQPVIIERTLDSHQLHAMGTARFVRLELPRLAAEETAEYVRHFLRMEGVEEELGFTTRQLAALHSESGGLPGRVNELVIRTLRDATLTRPDPLPTRLLRWLRRLPPATAGATASVTLLLLLTLLFQEQLEGLLQSSESTDAPDPAPREEEQKMQPDRQPSPRSVQPLLLPPVAERLDPTPETTEGITAAPGSPLKSTAPTPQLPETEEDSRAEIFEADPPSQSSGPEMPSAGQEPPQPTPLPKPQQAAPEPAKVPEPKQPEVAATPKPLKPKPAPDPIFKREAWLLKQRPDSYTLQILAAGNERWVREFARKHQLTTDVYYYKSQRNGRPWIALLLGTYKDRKTAVTVLNMLPDTLREAGAWPRSLASVQKEIRGER